VISVKISKYKIKTRNRISQ